MRLRDERGIALPTPVAALALAGVLLAGIAFVASGGTPPAPDVARPVTAAPSPTPSPVTKAAEPVAKPKQHHKKKPAVRRGAVYVEVYNNSGVSGLAGSTADRIAGAGWQVVGSDNWYGTIPASTVYYPERLAQAAKMLARDIGVERLKPAISPMRGDRLTVILTGDYA